MSVTCHATFHQGNERHIWENTGSTIPDAFSNATRSASNSFVSVTNSHAGIRLLQRFVHHGERPSGRYVKEEGAYLSVDDNDQPIVSIGWVTFTFTQD